MGMGGNHCYTLTVVDRCSEQANITSFPAISRRMLLKLSPSSSVTLPRVLGT